MSEDFSKRFEGAKDPELRPRLDMVADVLRELPKRFPEIVGTVLFGSQTRGRAHKDSDYDAYVFIDADFVVEHNPSFGGDVPLIPIREDVNLMQGQKIIGATSLRNIFGTNIKEQYKLAISLQILQAVPELELAKVEQGIIPVPISIKLIDSELERLIEYYSTEHEEILPVIANQTVFGEEARQTPPNALLLPSYDICSMFHLQVGHGLYSYRNHIIDRLIEAGPIGEKIWRHIIDTVNSW